MTEQFSDATLQAYVDDQLDPAGRLEVADYLVRNPETAGRVLSDLRAREAMRLLASGDAPSPRLVDAAARVDRALRRRQFVGQLSRIAAAIGVLLVGTTIGVSVHDHSVGLASPAKAAMPVYVEEALMSHRTALLRQHMRSQQDIPHFDPGDIRDAAHISVPQLPDGWHIKDVQLFPSDYGPSLLLVIDSGRREPLSLFAARAKAGVPKQLVVDRVDGDVLACWSRAGTVYVLTGSESPAYLRAAALDLSDNRDA